MFLTRDELNDANEQLRQQAELRKRIAESAGDYLKFIKDIKKLQKDIAQTEELHAQQQAKYDAAEIANNKLKTAASQEAFDIEKAKLNILSKNLNYMKAMNVELVTAAKETSKITKSLAVFKEVKKDVSNITSIVKTGYGKLKGWAGLFDMDKALRMSALNLGVLSKQTEGFRDNIKSAANNTISFGVGMAKLAEIHSNFGDELGRSVMLTQKGLEGLGAMAAATGLGAEGSAKLAADMDNVGYSAERTKDFIEQTMNDAHKMGLNASKVVKNISANIKMLNKYNFKGGVKGLAKMAETTTKLGVDMNVVSGMADKLFDIEGAVDMSSQLQVMGGEWSKLGDPFKLMYMARNDMEGLTEAMGNAAEGSVHFNSKSKEFEISALEMHKLRKVAEQTGVSYEELAQMGKNAAKFTKVKSQISFTADKETKEFLANTSQFDEKGKAYVIDVDGDKKYLNQLDKTRVKAMMTEKASLEERAEASQTFDEKIVNMINQFKQMLLPVLEGLDKQLRPVIQGFVNKMKDPKFLKTVQDIGKKAGELIGIVGKFIANNPIKSLAMLGLFEAAKWFLNGRTLGMGFNSVASVGGGDAGGELGIGGKFMKGFSKILGGKKTMLGRGARNMAASMGRSSGSIGKIGGKAGGMLGGAGKMLGGAAKRLPVLGALKDQFDFFSSSSMRKTGAGGWLESLGGSGMSLLDGLGGDTYNPIKWFNNATGLSIEGMGTDDVANARAVYRSKYPDAPTAIPNTSLIDDIKRYPDTYPDNVVESAQNVQNVEDGVAKPGRGPFTITDKYGKMAKTHSQDGLAVGPHIGGSQGTTNHKHEFGKIDISGTIKLEIPGLESIPINLTKDPQFIRKITRMIHAETEKVIQGGKNKG